MFTEPEFVKLIEEFSGDIKKQVHNVIKKIQQPSPYEFEDLVNEAVMEAWKKFKKNYKPEASSPRTFLFMCVKNSLYDIMYYSWRKPNLKLTGSLCEDEDSSQFQFVDNRNNFTNEVKLLFDEEVFSKSEQEYIKLLVFPEQELAEKNAQNPRRVRINVREKLGIDNTAEYNLRESIKKKLTKRISI